MPSRQSTGQPSTTWGRSGGGGDAYRMPMQQPAGVLTYGVLNGHLMQWWENSRRPHFSVVLPVAQQPAAQQPVATILTPSNFLSAVQDVQDRNVGPLSHLMALAPVKLPQFQKQPQDEREHLHAHLRLGRRARTGYPSAKRSPPPLTPRCQDAEEKRPCTGPGPLRMRPLGQSALNPGQLDFAARFNDSVLSVGTDGTCYFSYRPSGCNTLAQATAAERRRLHQ